jgi:hypothetical protein
LGSNNLVVISLNFKSALGILFASSKAIDDAEKILNSLGLFSAFFFLSVRWGGGLLKLR